MPSDEPSAVLDQKHNNISNNQNANAAIYISSFTGHNCAYAALLCRGLISNNVMPHLIVPRGTLESTEYSYHLSDMESEFSVTTHDYLPGSTPFKNSWSEGNTLIDSVLALDSAMDTVLCPAGSSIPFLWPLVAKVRHSRLPQRCLFFFTLLGTGIHPNQNSFSSKLKNATRAFLLSRNRAGSLLTIDGCGYDKLSEQPFKLKQTFNLVPDPIIGAFPVDRTEARTHLGFSDSDFVVSILGAISSHPRKNLRSVIEALGLLMNPRYKLLLAGKLDQTSIELVANQEPSVRKRIVALNRYLSEEEINQAICASDVVCAPYEEHYAPSGIVLRAAKLRTPVLVPDYHWFSLMIQRFQLGWACSNTAARTIAGQIEIAATELQEAKHEIHDYNFLVSYFSEANFLTDWLYRLGFASKKPLYFGKKQ